jgi:hypothetical protein
MDWLLADIGRDSSAWCDVRPNYTEFHGSLYHPRALYRINAWPDQYIAKECL